MPSIDFNGVRWGCTCSGNNNDEHTSAECRDQSLQDDSYEPFRISAGRTGWDFCKADRKPYDSLVAACLLVLKYHLPEHCRHFENIVGARAKTHSSAA